jgi:hypothetical protein
MIYGKVFQIQNNKNVVLSEAEEPLTYFFLPLT